MDSNLPALVRLPLVASYRGKGPAVVLVSGSRLSTASVTYSVTSGPSGAQAVVSGGTLTFAYVSMQDLPYRTGAGCSGQGSISLRPELGNLRLPAAAPAAIRSAYTGVSIDERNYTVMSLSGEALTGGDVEYDAFPCRVVGGGKARVGALVSPSNLAIGGGLGGGGAEMDSVISRDQITPTKVVRLRVGRRGEFFGISLGGGEGGMGDPGLPDPNGAPDDPATGTGGRDTKQRPGGYVRSLSGPGTGGYRYKVNLRVIGGRITYLIDYFPDGDGVTLIVITGWRSRGSGLLPKRLFSEAIGESGASPSSTGNAWASDNPYQPGGRPHPSEEPDGYTGGSLLIEDKGPGSSSGGYSIIDLTKLSPYGDGEEYGEDDWRRKQQQLPLSHADGGDDGNSPGGEGDYWPTSSKATVNTEYFYGSPGKGNFSPYARMGISAGLPRIVCSIVALQGANVTIASALPTVTSKIKALQGIVGVIAATATRVKCKLYPRPGNPARLVMVTNTLTGAVSTYEGFPFNSFCEIGGVYFGSGPDGVCRIDVGDTDVGAPISAGIGTGYSALGDSHQKRLINAYIKARTQSPLSLRVSADGRSTDAALLTPRSPDKFAKHRVALARGLRGKHWMFEVNNTDGGKFDLGHIEVEFAPSTRRV